MAYGRETSCEIWHRSMRWCQRELNGRRTKNVPSVPPFSNATLLPGRATQAEQAMPETQILIFFQGRLKLSGANLQSKQGFLLLVRATPTIHKDREFLCSRKTGRVITVGSGHKSEAKRVG